MKEFRKVLIYIDSILLPKGFKLFESEESGCIICDYRKSTNQSINSIAFLKREDKIKGFYYAVNFIEMELIIIPILTKNKLFGDVKPENIDESFWVQKDTRYTLSDDGKDISEYEEVVNIFNLFYKQEALPFFEKWKDLNVLYEYIKDKSIKTNPLAIKVKINDLRDNMDITRLVHITEKDTERLNKYLKAYQELKACL